MRTLRVLVLSALAATVALPAAAVAQNRFGLGVETSLTSQGTNGSMLFSFDTREWRVDGLFGLAATDGAVGLNVGGRFLYAVHTSERADLSVGAGVFLSHGARGEGPFANDVTRGEVDALAQIRVFLVPSVALLGSLGMGIGFGDGGVTVSLAGQLSGSFGLVYFF
jgi:hypothetical protein